MQVIGAILILIAGYFVAHSISRSRWLIRLLEKREFDVTLTGFLGSLAFVLIMGCFAVIALGKFGISITPFVVALGAFTLGAGLAVQSIVSNYGAGFSIILTGPFVVGNTLTVQGVSGVVEQIRLPYTVLASRSRFRTRKSSARSSRTNSSANSWKPSWASVRPTTRRSQLTPCGPHFSRMTSSRPTPAPQIGIDEFTDTALRIGIRFFVPTAAYYQSKYAVNGLIYRTLKAAEVPLALPRQEIQLIR